MSSSLGGVFHFVLVFKDLFILGREGRVSKHEQGGEGRKEMQPPH